MKTQLHLYVKDETFWTKFGYGVWFVNIFRKLPLDITIDGSQTRFKPQKEPYVIDLAPGAHTIEGTDPRARSKKASDAVFGAMMGASLMGVAGGSMLEGAAIGADAASSNVTKTGCCSLQLNDGDIIKLSCRANKKGVVVFKTVK